MSGLQNMTGMSAPITIDGVTYLVSSQLTFDMRGEVEAIILSKRPKLMKEAAESLKYFDKAYHKEIIAEAVKRSAMAAFVTDEEYESYLNTEEGTAYLLWLMIREKQPQVDSLEKALAIARKIDLFELQQKLDEAAGLTQLKNSAGPAASQSAAGQIISTPLTDSSTNGKADFLGPGPSDSSAVAAIGTSEKSEG